MRPSKEQKFLYSRVAILIASAGSVASLFAGWNGFVFWYVGFVPCFWLAFALLNYPYKTSLWMFTHRRKFFLIFYGALAGSLLLLDQMGLRLHLWFYPLYHDFWFVLLYGVLYPMAALAELECFYFLTHLLEEPLTFKPHKATSLHKVVDGGEGVLFLFMTLFVMLGASGYPVSLFALFISSILWMFFAAVKLGLHIAHPAHLVLLAVVVAILAVFLNKLQNTAVVEWIYFQAPTLNVVFCNIPLWTWLCSFWFAFFTLRLWIFLVLHPRIKPARPYPRHKADEV